MFSGLQASITLKSNGLSGDAGGFGGDELAMLQSVSQSSNSNALSTVDQVLKKLGLLAEAVKLKGSIAADDVAEVPVPISAGRSAREFSSSAVFTATATVDTKSHGNTSSRAKVRVRSPARRLTPRKADHLAGVLGSNMLHSVQSKLKVPGLQLFHRDGIRPGDKTIDITEKSPKDSRPKSASITSRVRSITKITSTSKLPSVDGEGVEAVSSRSTEASPTTQRHNKEKQHDDIINCNLQEIAEVLDEREKCHAHSGPARAPHLHLPATVLSGAAKDQLANQFHSTNTQSHHMDGLSHSMDGGVRSEYVEGDSEDEDAEIAHLANEIWANPHGLSTEVRTLQDRVDAIVGNGIDYSSIRALYEGDGEVQSHPQMPGPSPTNRAKPAMPVGLAGLNDLMGLAPDSPSVDTLPSWLKARPDFQTVESEARKLGTAAVQGQGFGKGALVLVKRALDTPGPSRGSKDIEVLSAWLQNIDQFSHLGAVQRAVVARSLVVEHLQPGSKMTPTAEGVYVVLSGYLHIMRADGTGEIVGPGQSLGSRAWWNVMSSAIEQRQGKLGRRLSLIVSAARSEAKKEAREMLGGLTRSLSASIMNASPVNSRPHSRSDAHAFDETHSKGGQGGMSTADLLKSALGLGKPSSPADEASELNQTESAVSLTQADAGSGEAPTTARHPAPRRGSNAAIEKLRAVLSRRNSTAEDIEVSAAPQEDPSTNSMDSRRTMSRSSSAAQRGRRARRMSLFDASCIGRALAPQDVGNAAMQAAALQLGADADSNFAGGRPASSASGTSSASFAGLSNIVRTRLQGLSLQDLDRLGTLTADDVLDGVTLVRLGLGEYNETLSRHRRMVTTDTTRYLHDNIKDFASWGSTRLAALAGAFERRTYPPHHVIYRQGDVVDSICLIQSGAVHLYRQADAVGTDTFPTGHNSWRQQRQIKQVLVHVGRVDTGHWFGLEALSWYPILAALDGELRSQDIVDDEKAPARRGAPGSVVYSALRHMDVVELTQTVATVKQRRQEKISAAATLPAPRRRSSITNALQILRRRSSVDGAQPAATPDSESTLVVDAPPNGEDRRERSKKLPQLNLSTSFDSNDAVGVSSPQKIDRSLPQPSPNRQAEGETRHMAQELSPPVRDISAISEGPCVVLHLRPEYFQLLQHKGLLPALQSTAQLLQDKINDTKLLDERNEKRQLGHAVRLLRDEAYGPRYTRSVGQGVVLVPETEPSKTQRESSMYIYEEGVLTESVNRALAWSKRLGSDLPYIQDQIAALPPRAISRLNIPKEPQEAGEEDPALKRAWFEKLHEDAKHLRQEATKPKGRRKREQAFGTTAVRLYDDDGRADTQDLQTQRSQSPARGTATIKGGDATVVLADNEVAAMIGHDGATEQNSPVRRSQSQRAQPRKVYSSLSEHARRLTPLPTAGLRRIKVPLEVYYPLASSKSSQTLPLGLDSKHPRMLTRVPVLPDVHKPPSPEKILNKQNTRTNGNRGRVPQSTSFNLSSTDVCSMEERMNLIYEKAHLNKPASATATAASVGSAVVVQDRAKKFDHLQALRLAREAQEEAISETVIGHEPVDSEILRYKSPVEKAHADILNALHQKAAFTLQDVMRKTYRLPIDAPHATLPSYWPAGIPKHRAGTATEEESRPWSAVNVDPIAPTMATAKAKNQAGGGRDRSASHNALQGTRPVSRLSGMH